LAQKESAVGREIYLVSEGRQTTEVLCSMQVYFSVEDSLLGGIKCGEDLFYSSEQFGLGNKASD
jgi:hypothetical protein